MKKKIRVSYDVEIVDGKLNLPEGARIKHDLDLLGLTAITTLPDNLSVGGNLYLSGTGIRALPNNLHVGGDLYLTDTPITVLPVDLRVGGNLDLRGTAITEVPKSVNIGGSTYGFKPA